MRQAEALSVGFEMIMEAWGFEYPFNNRAVFVPEWEELWMRYLIARYDAFNCVFFWTPMNEYEYSLSLMIPVPFSPVSRMLRGQPVADPLLPA